MMMRLVDLIGKVLDRFLSTPIPKEYEVMTPTEPEEPVQTDAPDEPDPYKSIVQWCYLCRQQLGDEHDPSDPGCIKNALRM